MLTILISESIRNFADLSYPSGRPEFELLANVTDTRVRAARFETIGVESLRLSPTCGNESGIERRAYDTPIVCTSIQQRRSNSVKS